MKVKTNIQSLVTAILTLVFLMTVPSKLLNLGPIKSLIKHFSSFPRTINITGFNAELRKASCTPVP